MAAGGCYCGNIRYEITGEPLNAAICHCRDCQRHSGSASVAWIMLDQEDFEVTKGVLKTCEGKNGALRSFCGECGTGIIYQNENFIPGRLDVQTATLDDPEGFSPQARIQLADQLSWDGASHQLPGFDGFPSQD